MPVARTSSRFRTVQVALAVAVLGPSALGAAPAGAEIESLDPSSAEVKAGDTLVLEVVEVQGKGCLGSSAQPKITVSIEPKCDKGEWDTKLTFIASPETPPGTYPVVSETRDGEPVRQVFHLTVKAKDATTTTTTTSTTSTTTTTAATTLPTTTQPPSDVPPAPPGGGTVAPGPGPAGGSAQAAGGDGPPAGAAAGGSSTGTGAGRARSTGGAAAGSGGAAPTGPAGLLTAGGEAPAPVPAAPAFAPLTSLVGAEPSAGESLFLPFAGDALQSCVPLEGPCGDPAGGLVLVPAGAVDVAWTPPESGPSAPLRSPPTRDVPPMPAVGAAPPDPDETTFLLPVLRVSAGSTKLVVMARRFEPGSGLVAGPSSSSAVLPTAIGAALPPPAASPTVAFGPPALVADEELTSRTPVVVLFGAGQMPVLFGIQPDPAWKLKRAFLPLFGAAAAPFLAERLDGAVGLLLPRPPDLVLSAPEGPLATAVVQDDDAGPRNGNAALVATLFGLVLSGVGVTAASRGLPGWWSRRFGTGPGPGARWRRIL